MGELSPLFPLPIRWPETLSEVITLARQSALPGKRPSCVVPLATVLAVLAQADAATGSVVTGEMERVSATETFHQRIEQARKPQNLIAIISISSTKRRF